VATERALEVLVALVTQVTDANLVTLMPHPGELLLSVGWLYMAPAGLHGELHTLAANRRDAARAAMKALLNWCAFSVFEGRCPLYLPQERGSSTYSVPHGAAGAAMAARR